MDSIKPIFIKNFLPEQVHGLVNKYCQIKYSIFNNFEETDSTGSFIAEYGDYLIESLLDLSTPVVEQNIGKKLFPTYSYVRIYDKLSDLAVHKDRESCEYTVALALASMPSEHPYRIYLGSYDDNSDYRFRAQTEGIDYRNDFIGVNIEESFDMFPNDALIFQGQDKLHWRDTCMHDHFITVFLHYVEQEGPLSYKKYDERSFLGLPKPKN